MADKARKLTNKKLLKMERHLAAVYTRFEKETREKMMSFAEPFEKETTKLLKAYNEASTKSDKKSAERKYKNSINKHFLRNPNFKKLINTMAVDYYKKNEESADYINGKTPEIYQINYNAVGKGLQNDLIDYNFEEVSIVEVKKYGNVTQKKVLKTKDVKWNEENFKNAVKVGAMMFLDAFDIMKSASIKVANKNENSAIMYAGDMVTDAASKGSLDSMWMAEESGYEGITKIWLTAGDNRVRPTHQDLDGYEIALDKDFPNGLDRPRDPNGPDSEIYRCRCDLDYGVGLNRSRTRAARLGKVTGSYTKSKSFEGTKTVDAPNIPYKELMKWLNSKS